MEKWVEDCGGLPSRDGRVVSQPWETRSPEPGEAPECAAREARKGQEASELGSGPPRGGGFCGDR